ncbi:UNVERIFIED_ORG: hypothetical protein FHR35_002699 [Microbispora rosea subsp. rosea]
MLANFAADEIDHLARLIEAALKIQYRSPLGAGYLPVLTQRST